MSPPPSRYLTLVAVNLIDAHCGAHRTVTLQLPVLDARGHSTLQERQLEVQMPAGVRAGQRLRLAGQGGTGQGGAPAGNLLLEIELLPHPVFRLEAGGHIDFDLSVSPWEAVLGVIVTAPAKQRHVRPTHRRSARRAWHRPATHRDRPGKGRLWRLGSGVCGV